MANSFDISWNIVNHKIGFIEFNFKRFFSIKTTIIDIVNNVLSQLMKIMLIGINSTRLKLITIDGKCWLRLMVIKRKY